MHAYEPRMLNLLGKKGQLRLGVIYDSLSQHSAQELNKVSTYLQKNHDNLKHTFVTVSKSDTLPEAVQMVATNDIDLIAMVTQGATGAKEVFMGSNTFKIMNYVKKCAVLAIPSDSNFQRLKTLAFPSDFSRIFTKFALLPLTELAMLWKTDIQVFHVALEFALNDQQIANQEILKKRCTPLGITFHNIDFDANVAHTIEKYVSEADIDLLAMIRYQHTFWEK